MLDSVQDMAMAREVHTSNVIGRLRSATLDHQQASESGPAHAGEIW